MKGSVRKMIASIREKRTNASSSRKRRDAGSTGGLLIVDSDVSGRTVFHDRPLRFRSLTIAEADLSMLEETAAGEGAFKIRIARRGDYRREARPLVAKKYASRGYTLPSAAPRPRVLTFIAYDEGRIVGTVGVGADADGGLSADQLYRAEIDRLRSAGCRVCEFTRLAVDRNAASKSVLAGLFHTAYLYASRVCGHTHAVIEVNPRHVSFYHRELHFETIGPQRPKPEVNAPAVLLCASFETIAAALARYAGKAPPKGAKRMLFHYGFPPEQEQGILDRLYRLVAGN